MGKRVMTFSDLSGKEMEDPKETATLTVAFFDKRRGTYQLDITKDEAEEYVAKGVKVTES